MYLKTLQLRGFKSFASATTLEFEPGITCVVGPNGSGKSNVVDALSWVMGEQGVKTLRGGKMEDVIFAGTTSRAALGRAEVSLTIDNSDGALDIAYTEVTLTRTLFRNGGSEYAINGAQCRLLDIQDLLSDTGLGREMHVIVGQGQLDSVLRATPAERRGFIEEAAGVLKHRKRKEKALRKLDSMQGNLLRLKDLLAELRRQLGPLSRQAKAAQRAHTLAAAVRDSGLRLLGDDLVAATQELDSYLADTQHRKKTLAHSETELQSLQETLASKEHAAALASPHATAAGQTLRTLQSQREQLRSLLTLSTERLRHLGTASDDLDIDLDQLRTNLERVTQAAAAAQTQVERAREEANASTATRQEAEAKLREATAVLAQYDREAGQHRDRVAQLGSRVSAQRSTVTALAQEIDRLHQEHLEAQERQTAIQQQTPEESANLESLTAQENEARAVLDRVTGELRAAQEAHSALDTARATVRSKLAGATARAQALELSLAHGHGDQAVLNELDQVAGQVLSMFSAPTELERALAAALGVLGSAAMVMNQTLAVQVVQSDQAATLASATILHPVQNLTHPSSDQVRTAAHSVGGEVLSEQVSIEAESPWLRQSLSELIASVIVVPDLAGAQELIALAPWATAVTRDGHVLKQGQVRLWASQDGPLKLRTELGSAQKDLAAHTRELDRLEKEQEAAAQKVGQTQDSVDSAQQEFDRVQANHQEIAQAQRLTQGLIRTAAQEVERVAAKIAAGQKRLEQSSTGLEAEAAQLEQVRVSPAVDPDRRGQLSATVSHVEAKLSQLRDLEMTHRVTLRGLQEQAASLNQRVGGAQRTLANQEQAAKRAQAANERREKMAQRARTVQSTATHALSMMDRSLLLAQENLDQITQASQARDTELHELRVRAEHLHRVVREHMDAVHKDELHHANLSQKIEILEGKAVENFGMAPADVMDHFGPHVPIQVTDQLDDQTGQETRVVAYSRAVQLEIFEQSTRKLAALGKINPLALEEFTALEERHQFLTEQLEDLTSTRADLVGLVADIDTRVEQAFAHAYEDTAKQFEKVFGRLFPGGTGRLILEDPDDPLTTGIEIEARPAGKQVKRLSLLSGGERSLAAIAFLVAIFLARPSPFYVMDEVEAALDDVNLGRLLAVFEELRENSQLIVITHQKRTMQIADALYGVTMAGDGISTVISQRLDSRTA